MENKTEFCFYLQNERDFLFSSWRGAAEQSFIYESSGESERKSKRIRKHD